MNTAFAALQRVLQELAGVVRELSPDDYVRPTAPAGKGSVGAHVRHCLDHVAALERGMSLGLIDYDDRVRYTAVETDKAVGLASLEAAQRRLADVDPCVLDAAIIVSIQVGRGAAPLVVASTIGRELAFVISHTIHHSATVSVLLQARGRRLPATFGLAVSTPLAAERATCALSA